MLLSYRTSPNPVTLLTPFELLRGRRPSTKLVPWWLKDKNKVNGEIAEIDYKEIRRKENAYKSKMKEQLLKKGLLRILQCVWGIWYI